MQNNLTGFFEIVWTNRKDRGKPKYFFFCCLRMSYFPISCPIGPLQKPRCSILRWELRTFVVGAPLIDSWPISGRVLRQWPCQCGDQKPSIITLKFGVRRVFSKLKKDNVNTVNNYINFSRSVVVNQCVFFCFCCLNIPQRVGRKETYPVIVSMMSGFV